MWHILQTSLTQAKPKLKTMFLNFEMSSSDQSDSASCLLCSSSHTVCSSPWPSTWGRTSRQLHMQQWTNTSQRSLPFSPRNTDEGPNATWCEDVHEAAGCEIFIFVFCINKNCAIKTLLCCHLNVYDIVNAHTHTSPSYNYQKQPQLMLSQVKK